MATAAKEKESKAPEVKATGRSASYPWIDLETAVQRLDQFWKVEKAYEAPISAAFKHWGYGLKSSGARLTLAAMLNYGLLSDKGSNEERMVKITSLGVDIVMAPNPEARLQSLKLAAQKPRVFAELLKTMDPENLPSDQTIAHYLVTKKGFNPTATGTFLKNFKGTIKYANLKKSDIMSSDFTALDEDYAGLQVKEINLDPHAVATDKTIYKPTTPQRGFKQDVYPFADGGQVILQWPEGMSKESFAEFEDWIALVLRKIARASGVKQKSDEKEPPKFSRVEGSR
jgi:hypothetical protein